MVRDVGSWKRPVSIAMTNDQVEEIDRVRGDVPRSRWIGELIDQAIESQLLREGDRP